LPDDPCAGTSAPAPVPAGSPPDRHLVVDGANVVGSRPDGWWRDRAGAATRLAEQLVAALDAGALDVDRVLLVLEGAARGAVVPEHPRLAVVRAQADGDSAIVELAAALAGDVTVVTADRGLRARLTARAVGPGTLLDRLP
jgi:hypothetical protein